METQTLYLKAMPPQTPVWETVRIGRFEIDAACGLELVLAEPGAEIQGQVWEFARQAYSNKYGADLKVFCREILMLRSRERGIISCVGINTPETGGIFLEQYLDRPVEEELSRRLEKVVTRDMLAEIGTMAVAGNGLCRLMMAGLAGFILTRGKRYLVFTAVKTLRNTLNHLEVPFITLTSARPERLKGGVESWGSYYEASPEVIAIDLSDSWTKIKTAVSRLNRKDPQGIALLMQGLFIKGAALGGRPAILEVLQ